MWAYKYICNQCGHINTYVHTDAHVYTHIIIISLSLSLSLSLDIIFLNKQHMRTSSKIHTRTPLQHTHEPNTHHLKYIHTHLFSTLTALSLHSL